MDLLVVQVVVALTLQLLVEHLPKQAQEQLLFTEMQVAVTAAVLTKAEVVVVVQPQRALQEFHHLAVIVAVMVEMEHQHLVLGVQQQELVNCLVVSTTTQVVVVVEAF
jgi:hypothetical protein